MKRKNKGFTLVEMVITVAIFAILLGVLTPSLNSIIGFRVQRAAESIGAALDKTKTESLNRLVGEMVLEKQSDGYYITYYLYRGEQSGMKADDPEKIAPAKTHISYKINDSGDFQELAEGQRLIFTFNRENGSFRPLQTEVLETDSIKNDLKNNKNIQYRDSRTDTYDFCTQIRVFGGYRTRVITLHKDTGSYTISAG